MKRKVRGRKVKRIRLNEREGEEFQRSRRNKAICGLVSIVLLFLVGCGGGGPTSTVLPKPKEAAGERRKPEVVPAVSKMETEKKEEIEYSYIPEGKPDPFKPFIQLSPVKEASRNVPLTPLQRYEVSQLKLVAIMSVPGGNVALVEDSSGKGFFLKKGTQVGKNEGKVTKILKDRVIIEEVFQDILGQPKQNEVSLNLYRTEEGGEP